MAIPMRPIPAVKIEAAIKPLSLSEQRRKEDEARKALTANVKPLTPAEIHAREEAAKNTRAAQKAATRAERKGNKPSSKKEPKEKKATAPVKVPVATPILLSRDLILEQVRIGRMSAIEGSIRRSFSGDALEKALQFWKESKTVMEPWGKMPYGMQIDPELREAVKGLVKVQYPGKKDSPFRADDYSAKKEINYTQVDREEEKEAKFTGVYIFARRSGTEEEKLEALLSKRIEAGRLTPELANETRKANEENEQAERSFVASSGDDLMRAALRYVLEGERVSHAQIHQGVILTLIHQYKEGDVTYEYAVKRKWYASEEAAEEAGIKAVANGLKIGKDAKGEDKILTIHRHYCTSTLVRSEVMKEEKAPKPEPIKKKDTTVYQRKDFDRGSGKNGMKLWAKAKSYTCHFSHG